LIERAIRLVGEIERRRERFAVKAVLMDPAARDKTDRAVARARGAGFLIVWQDPDHEAMLLRHLPVLALVAQTSHWTCVAAARQGTCPLQALAARGTTGCSRRVGPVRRA